MNCANHPDIAATAFCRTCGKPLCAECQRPVKGTVVCAEHAPVEASAYGTVPGTAAAGPTPGAPPPSASPAADNPWVAPPPRAQSSIGASPGLAFVLGLIPGVGAVYNGQYAKGLIHAVIFGTLVSINTSDAAPGMEVLFGVLTLAWTFYMAFEAYHTSARRSRGEAVDEFSSVFPIDQSVRRTGFPIGPVMMIALGFVFLLNTLDLVSLRAILRFWPVFLIALGAYMLWARLTGPVQPQETTGRD
jgi:TM2 domain-containing membrane protein YozV